MMKELPQNEGEIGPLPEIFSGDFEEVASYSNDVFNKGRGILDNRKLLEEELEAVGGLVDHLRYAWNLKYTDPLVMQGIEVIQSHFARVFGLEPTASYGSILEQALPRRYFENRTPDAELKAFSKVMGLDLTRRDIARDRGEESLEVDFYGLVNPDWRPK